MQNSYLIIYLPDQQYIQFLIKGDMDEMEIQKSKEIFNIAISGKEEGSETKRQSSQPLEIVLNGQEFYKKQDSNMENTTPQQYYQVYATDTTMQKDVDPCSFKELFRFADRKDYILMIIGTIFSLANGVSLIFYALPFGQLVQAFAPNKDKQQIVDDALESVKLFLINSAIVFVNSWFMSAAWTITSQRQMIRARKAYFASLMRQQVAWHDRNRPAQICSKMYIEISKVHQGLVNNVTSVLSKISIGVSGILIAMVRGWQMALVMIAFLPVMMLSGFISSYYLKKIEKYQQKTKARFDSQVIQVFDNVRTVRMLDGQQHETTRYQVKLEKSQQENTKNGIKNKLSFATFFFCILMNYSLGFWYGAKLVSEETINTLANRPYSVADVIIIFFTLYMSNLSLSGLPESITSFNISRISMKRISHMVERQSRIIDGDQTAPTNITKIVFQNVLFQYDRPLFKNFNFHLEKGMTALIGQSGSGKTTIINLIMRFYDIFEGSIIFQSPNGNANLTKLTNESLRDRIGYVGQQPVLIGKTLREALNVGDTSDQQIISLLKMVKAWNFVEDIGLDSEYAMLSGGQKQRIAIARALIKKPEILILDEGTSALDRTTEQNVLDSIKKLKIPFVIMIAHRMQTVIHCDSIVKLENGQIVASGTYEQLVKKGIVEQLNLEKKEKNEDVDQTGKIDITDKKKQQILKIIENDQAAEKNSEDDEEEEKEEKEFKMSYIGRLMKFNKKYWYLYLIGIIGSLFIGAIFPTYAYLLSNIIVTLSGVKYAKDDQQLAKYQDQVSALSLSLFMISIGSLLIVALRGVSFTHLTEALGFYIKKKSFQTSINKPMVVLDQYGPQQYAHIITTNCEDLKHLGGHHIGDMLQNIVTVLVGLAIAFAFSWQITLISLAVFPLIILSGKLQMSFNHGMQSNTDKVHKKTHQTVIESIMFIKTVKSLSLQDKIINKYEESLEQALAMAIKYGNLSGIMFGFGQTLISCLLALIFYFGALMIRAGVVDVLSLYTAIYAIMFAGVQAGGNLYFLSRLGMAKMAACNYFQMIQTDQQPQEHSVYIANNRGGENEDEPMRRIKGDIELNDIQFKYASRDTSIFKNFYLKIKKGQKVALVGQSGSGKSTITNLIFKIYEPISGQILIDGKNINSYHIGHLRRQIGIVSQEPVLFNRSVYQNIKYNCKSATFDDVVAAAKMAKAYDFVCQGNFGMKEQGEEQEQEEMQKERDNRMKESSTEEKLEKAKNTDQITIQAFKKKVGTRGSYLSGGQKQRIAIARALIRTPSVIVLDEATSALDNENEKMVQQAIQSIHGATQIVIAHRLSTVQNCNKIVVMKKGNIVEEGGYHELLKRGGYFYKLVNAIKDQEKEEKPDKSGKQD